MYWPDFIPYVISPANLLTLRDHLLLLRPRGLPQSRSHRSSTPTLPDLSAGNLRQPMELGIGDELMEL